MAKITKNITARTNLNFIDMIFYPEELHLGPLTPPALHRI